MMEKDTRVRKESEVVSLDKKENKNYLEELLEKSRAVNETNNKTLSDGMNMIFAKMS